MTESAEAAVCIVGGGPAGAALAIRLAQLGYRVVLVERSRSPRRRLGESLSPGIWAHLDMLGARPAIERTGFPEFQRTLMDWESGAAVTREFIGRPGLLVDRRRFDGVMLDVARRHGVHVLHPAAIRERRFDGDGWRLLLDAGGRSIRVDAGFLALAGGRSASPSRTRRVTGPRTLALHACWRGPALPSDPCIEAGSDEWYWGMPLPNGSYSTMVFLDPERLRRDRAESLPAAFARLMARSTLIAGCRNAELVGPVLAADATPFVDEAPVDGHSIKVGEAALAIDPLSSSGVQRAMQSGLAAAVVVNTLLRRPADSAAALGFYRDNLNAAANRHRRWTAALYRAAAAGRDSRFWRDRAEGADVEPGPQSQPAGGPVPHPALPVALSPEAELVATACIVGDFVALRRALRHPRLAEPVAFLDGHELAPLLEQLRPGMTALDVVRSWSSGLAHRPAVAMIGWMLETGVLVSPPRGRRGDGVLSNAV
jgi:flavin-dependent dehydrogenase